MLPVLSCRRRIRALRSRTVCRFPAYQQRYVLLITNPPEQLLTAPTPQSRFAANSGATDRFGTAFVCVAWLVTTIVALWHEVPRFLAIVESRAGAFGWFFGMDADWSLPVIVLLALPLILLTAKVFHLRPKTRRAGQSPGGGGGPWRGTSTSSQARSPARNSSSALLYVRSMP